MHSKSEPPSFKRPSASEANLSAKEPVGKVKMGFADTVDQAMSAQQRQRAADAADLAATFDRIGGRLCWRSDSLVE